MPSAYFTSRTSSFTARSWIDCTEPKWGGSEGWSHRKMRSTPTSPGNPMAMLATSSSMVSPWAWNAAASAPRTARSCSTKVPSKSITTSLGQWVKLVPAASGAVMIQRTAVKANLLSTPNWRFVTGRLPNCCLPKEAFTPKCRQPPPQNGGPTRPAGG